MSLVAELVHITSPTATGNFTTNLPAKFDGILPKWVLLWTEDHATPDVFHANAIFAMGMGTFDGGTVQHAYLSGSAFPTDPSNAVRAKGTDALLKPFDADSTTPDAEYDLVSLNSGTPSTVVINVVNAPATAIKIHMLVVGGTDLAKARVGSFTVATAAGTQDVTIASGWGNPDLLFFFGAGFAATAGLQGNFFGDFGVAASSAARGASALAIGEGTAALYARWQDARAILSCGTGGTEDVEADITDTPPTDGFQINWINPSGSAIVMPYCAFQGDFQVAIGANSTLTSGAIQDNNVGFPPVVAGVFSANAVASGTPASSGAGLGAFSFGATDGVNEGCTALSVDDALTSNARYDRRSMEDKTLFTVDPETPDLRCEADGTFSGNNFRLTYTTLDTAAREYYYWVLGEAPAAGATSLAPPRETWSQILARR